LRACRKDDFNYLHLATAAKDSRVLKHLLRTEDLRDYINQNAKGEWSPLGYAISLGNERAIDMLLAHGANISQVSSRRGYNALHICAIYTRLNSAEMASKLLDHSHKLVNSRSHSGYTALHFAAVAGSVPLMNTLAARGAHLMAASNFLTPLGLAIAYWSELGVEEMSKIHMKKSVPLVAAFDRWKTPTPLPISQAVGPLTMILAPGRHSTMEQVRELRGRSGQAGCYDPPLSGLAENILRTILRYPASGHPVEYLKIWYYQITEQYSFRDTIKRGLVATLSHTLTLIFRFAVGSLWFVVYGVDEIHDAIRWAIRMGDSRVVEILLEERSHRNVSTNIRRLILHSQDRILTQSVMEQQDPLECTYQIALPEDYAKIVNLLMEQQNQIFSQVKLRRTNGGLRVLWRPLYRLYLDLEQKEYMRFNDWVFHKRLTTTPLVFEFRSWFPSPRISTYPLFFAILWAILGQMVYHLSRFIRNADEPFPTSRCVWTVFIVIIVSVA
jgi:Ankyrin repeats (many copies)